MPGYFLKVGTLYWKKTLEIESYGVDRKVRRSIEEIESWDPIAGLSPDRLILISPASVLFSAQH